MADETKDPTTRKPRRLQRVASEPRCPAPPANPAPPAPASAPAVVVGPAPAAQPLTDPEKRALARRLAGLPAESSPAPGPQPRAAAVVPIHQRPEDAPEWWRNHVGALLLVSEGTGNPTEIRLEGVSPNTDFLRCRPTGGAFMWRPRAVVRLLDVIAYPEEIVAYEQAWRRLYGQDTEAVDQKVKDAVYAALVEHGLIQPS